MFRPSVRCMGFTPHNFLIPTKDRCFQPVLDLCHLNQSVMERDWFVSVDAYFYVPIVPNFRKFLRFSFQGQAYQFRVLPFGLSLSNNTLSVFHLNHQGRTRILACLWQTRKILRWSHYRLALLRVVHLPGSDNLVADVLSRDLLGMETLPGGSTAEFGSGLERQRLTCLSQSWPLHWVQSSPLCQDALAPWVAELPVVLIPTFSTVMEDIAQNITNMNIQSASGGASMASQAMVSSPQGESWELPIKQDLLSQLNGCVWHLDRARLQLWVGPLSPIHCLWIVSQW